MSLELLSQANAYTVLRGEGAESDRTNAGTIYARPAPFSGQFDTDGINVAVSTHVFRTTLAADVRPGDWLKDSAGLIYSIVAPVDNPGGADHHARIYARRII